MDKFTEEMEKKIVEDGKARIRQLSGGDEYWENLVTLSLQALLLSPETPDKLTSAIAAFIVASLIKVYGVDKKEERLAKLIADSEKLLQTMLANIPEELKK